MFSSRRPNSRRRTFVFLLSLSKSGHFSIACIGLPILAPHAHFLNSLGSPFQCPISDSTGNPHVLARSTHRKSSVTSWSRAANRPAKLASSANLQTTVVDSQDFLRQSSGCYPYFSEASRTPLCPKAPAGEGGPLSNMHCVEPYRETLARPSLPLILATVCHQGHGRWCPSRRSALHSPHI